MLKLPARVIRAEPETNTKRVPPELLRKYQIKTNQLIIRCEKWKKQLKKYKERLAAEKQNHLGTQTKAERIIKTQNKKLESQETQIVRLHKMRVGCKEAIHKHEERIKKAVASALENSKCLKQLRQEIDKNHKLQLEVGQLRALKSGITVPPPAPETATALKAEIKNLKEQLEQLEQENESLLALQQVSSDTNSDQSKLILQLQQENSRLATQAQQNADAKDSWNSKYKTLEERVFSLSARNHDLLKQLASKDSNQEPESDSGQEPESDSDQEAEAKEEPGVAKKGSWWGW